MIKEKDKPRGRKVKGTVLFTVVCVMMVLIVFLMATLSLATTANKRAQTRFQKEQTEYTGRAVVDAVVDAINQDTAGTGLKKAMADHKTSAFNVQVTLDTTPYDVTVSPTDRKHPVYLSDSGKWVEAPLYAVQVNIEKSTTSAATVYTAYVAGDVDIDSDDDGDGGGAFVSMGQAQNEIGTGGYITGGTFIGLDNTDMKTFTLGATGKNNIEAPVFINGNFGYGTSAVMDIHFSGGGQFFAMSGDFYPEEEFHTQYGDWSGVDFTKISYEKIPAIYVGGEFKTDTNNSGITIGSTDVATNVFAGQFTIAPGNTGKGAGIYGDLYGFDPAKKNTLKGMGGETDLYKWTAQTVKKIGGTEAETFGNVFSAGDLELTGSGLTVNGDVRCNKDLTINGDNVKIIGDLVVAGTLVVNKDFDVSGRIIADKIVLNAKATLHNKEVSVNTLQGTGEFINPSVVKYASLPSDASSTETEVWYSDFSGTATQTGDDGQGDKKFFYDVEYSVTKHTVHRENGTQIGDEETEIITDSFTVHVHQWYINNHPGSTDEDIIFNMDPNYRDNNCPDSALVKKVQAATDETHKIETVSASAFNEDNLHGKGSHVTSSSVEARYGEKAYPEKYEKANMPGAVFTKPTSANFNSGYVTNVKDLGTDIWNPTGGSDGNGGYATGLPQIEMDDVAFMDYYEVTSSCVLKGTKRQGNIYINPTSSCIVVLDNLKCESSASGPVIVVNDDKPVVLFVRGACEIGGGIITKNYVDMAYTGITPTTVTPGMAFTNELTIPQQVDTSVAAQKKYLPQVIVYGEAGSSLTVPTGAHVVVTAQVRAPLMAYRHQMGLETAGINYTRPSGSSWSLDGSAASGGAKTKNAGVIGQLIAKTIAVNADQGWGLLYVTKKTSSGGGGGGGGSIDFPDKYKVMDYDIY